MRFLRLLFWLLIALAALLFLGRNWTDVTVDLWGNLQADIKLPLLLVLAFVLGWLPTSLGWRIRHWRLKKGSLEERSAVAAAATAPSQPPAPPPPPPFASELS